jgi:hypothetical protein
MLNHGETWIDRSAQKSQRTRSDGAPAPLNSNGKGFQTDSNPLTGLSEAGTDLPRASALSVPGTVLCDHKKEGPRKISEIEVSVRRATWSGAFGVVWFIVVVAGSLFPRSKGFFHIPHRFHLPVHVAVFAFSTFAAFGFAPTRGRRIFCSMALIGLGFVLEALQRAIYPIRFEWRDLVADTLGVLAALLFAVITDSRRDVSFDSGC